MLDNNDISQISEMIKQVLDEREEFNQFNVSPIPNHIHNGTDSPLIDKAANGIGSSSTSFGLFDSFIDLIHWITLGGMLTITSGSGQVNANDGYLAVGTSNLVNSYHGIASPNPYLGLNTTGKKTSVEWFINNIVSQTQNDIESRMYMTVDTGYPTDTNKHFGFKIIADGSSPTGIIIYGSVADGSTQATATLSTYEFTAGDQIRLRADYTAGSDCKFYVNGALKGTISTNLPGTTDLGLNITLKTLSAIQKELDFARVLINKQY